MSKVYSIGVIGAGARAETFAKTLHLGTPQARLFGICDHDGDRMEKFCQYCGLDGARRFTDPREFLASGEMDAVIVTVPDFAHRDVTLAALAAGKHVYLEKPLAPNLAQCRQIVAAAAHSDRTLYVGFNLRASPVYQKLCELARSGKLGRIIHVSAFEQMSTAHGASFMRRWHRREARCGGFLNHKCCHDLDIMQWIVGHEHRIARVASFGGLNIFRPDDGPKGHGTHCHNCPPGIYRQCRYTYVGGFMFPVHAAMPIDKLNESDVYGNDLCVYTADKDVVDNQTLIFEWDNGVRGDFTLQPFQHRGGRETRVWGELGMAEHLEDDRGQYVRHTDSTTGDMVEYRFAPRKGGHSGTDPYMLGRFIDALEGQGVGDSGVAEGFAATLLSLKADESRKTGKVVEIDPREYDLPT